MNYPRANEYIYIHEQGTTESLNKVDAVDYLVIILISSSIARCSSAVCVRYVSSTGAWE